MNIKRFYTLNGVIVFYMNGVIIRHARYRDRRQQRDAIFRFLKDVRKIWYKHEFSFDIKPDY